MTHVGIIVAVTGSTLGLASAAIRYYRGHVRPGEDNSEISDPYKSRRHKIAIIDDEVAIRFPAEMRDALEARGFQISYFEDISHITELANFPIVLCDVRGVGLPLALSSDFHGGIIVEELRKAYPLKFLIMFSTQAWNPNYNRYYRLADLRINRSDLYGENIVPILERAIAKITSPEEQWTRINNYLLVPAQARGDLSRRAKIKLEKLKSRIFSATPLQLAGLDRSPNISLPGGKIATSSEDILEIISKGSEVLLAILDTGGN